MTYDINCGLGIYPTPADRFEDRARVRRMAIRDERDLHAMVEETLGIKTGGRDMEVPIEYHPDMYCIHGGKGEDPRDKYPVKIVRVENGFTVDVGCKQFVFHGIPNLTRAIDAFYTDPRAATEEYSRKETPKDGE